MPSTHLPGLAVIGGGPAGLMAAETARAAGVEVDLFDAKGSVGRKVLIAGKGGLNLTHGEAFPQFCRRFGERSGEVSRWLQDFGPDDLRAWAAGLGVDTFVGSSGRVFPADLKAAPLLRGWVRRLREQGVRFHVLHRWLGWDEGGALRFSTPQGDASVRADAVVLALGGGSWARLGSNGAWVPLLAAKGVAVAPLLPANCGFDVQGGWTPFFSDKFAGQPFKSVAISVSHANGVAFQRKGEFVATATGVEGSLIYAASALLRDDILRTGSATIHLDLLPDMSAEKVLAEVRHPRGTRSLSSHLKSRLHLEGIKAAMLYERLGKEAVNDPVQLAAAIKALPITLQAARPIDEAISTAGGVLFEVLDEHLMCEAAPGVFCAGEMLDWEAPTGGYLLTACLASGVRAGQGVLAWLHRA